MQNLQPAGQPAAGDDEGERPLDHRHALLVQRQQLVPRHRQIVQIGDERPVGVDDDLAPVAPGQAADARLEVGG